MSSARRLSRPFRPSRCRSEPANITAIANDVGTEVIFLRQLIAHARPDDVAVGDLHQRRLAQHRHGARRGAQARPADGGLLGYDGGEIVRRGLADMPLVVRSDYIPRIQEVQASDLPHHPRITGGDAHGMTELYGTASCPYTQRDARMAGVERPRIRGVRRGSRRRRPAAHACGHWRAIHRPGPLGGWCGGAGGMAGPRLPRRTELDAGMHELSIAMSIMESVQDEVDRHGYGLWRPFTSVWRTLRSGSRSIIGRV